MLGGDAEKILPQVPAEPRGDPAEPAHRALRHALAPPQLVARQPAVGLRRGCGGRISGDTESPPLNYHHPIHSHAPFSIAKKKVRPAKVSGSMVSARLVRS